MLFISDKNKSSKMTDDVSSPNVEPEAVPAAPEEVLPAVDESVKKNDFF